MSKATVAERVGCKGDVWNGWNWVSCGAKAKRDGYCLRHHPEVKAQKRAARDAKWLAESNRQQRLGKIRDRVKAARDAVIAWARTVSPESAVVGELDAAEAEQRDYTNATRTASTSSPQAEQMRGKL